MTNPFRFAPLFAVLTACGGAEAPPSAPASSPSAPAPAASSTAETVAAPKAPATDGAWPFAAAPSDTDKKEQLDRLAKDAGPIKSNWSPPGKSERYGHAEGLINAPYDAVKARLLDFPHYKELAGPKFKKVNVVDKSDKGTDLYFQLPIMKGIVTIWYVTRFPGAKPAAGGDVIEGSFVKGNIKDMNIVFTLRNGPDANHTVMVCDLNLALSIPAPQEALDEELRDACGDAVNQLRARVAQGP